MDVTWVAISWGILGVELAFAVWAWRHSSAPLAAALVVTAGIAYRDLPSVPIDALGFVALFLVPVPVIEYGIRLRRAVFDVEADTLERRDSERHDTIPAIDDFFDRHMLVMRGLGFRHAGDFVETAARGDVTVLTYSRVFAGSDLRERATLQAVLRRGPRRDRLAQRSLSFDSRRENGSRVVTTNARMLFPFQGKQEEAAAFPRRKGAADLLEIHRARLSRGGASADRQPTPHDWLEETCALRRAEFDALADRGFLKRSAPSIYRMTWRGAFRLALTDCPVLWPFVALVVRRKETRLVAALRVPIAGASGVEAPQSTGRGASVLPQRRQVS